jgi:peptidyl-prolyl cis-trans isomerase C
MTTRNWMPVVLAASALALAACKHDGNKGEQAAAKPIVATVNGKAISGEAFEVWAQATINKKVEELNPEQKKQLLKSIEDFYIAGQEAEKLNVGATPEVAARLELDRIQTLSQAMFQDFIKKHPPSESDIKAEYDRVVGGMSKEEFHARHILVKEEAVAKDVIAKLAKGAKFEALAKQFSIDPGTKDQGGDLNWFTGDKMVPQFSEAVAKLTKGEYTKEPVATPFGFHVIMLEDKRPLATPPFEAIKDRLAPMAQQQAVRTYVESLRKAAKVEEKM